MFVVIVVLLIVAVVGWSGVRGRVSVRIARCLLLGRTRDPGLGRPHGTSVVAGAGAWS